VTLSGGSGNTGSSDGDPATVTSLPVLSTPTRSKRDWVPPAPTSVFWPATTSTRTPLTSAVPAVFDAVVPLTVTRQPLSTPQRALPEMLKSIRSGSASSGLVTSWALGTKNPWCKTVGRAIGSPRC
jgi:hypothetical protein